MSMNLQWLGDPKLLMRSGDAVTPESHPDEWHVQHGPCQCRYCGGRRDQREVG